MKKHNQWMQILSTIFKVLADIFSKLRFPETVEKTDKK